MRAILLQHSPEFGNGLFREHIAPIADQLYEGFLVVFAWRMNHHDGVNGYDVPVYFDEFLHGFFPHRVFAAFAAIWERLRGLRLAALAAPPLRPPRRPRATAWGFLEASTGVSCWPGVYFGAWP